MNALDHKSSTMLNRFYSCVVYDYGCMTCNTLSKFGIDQLFALERTS